MILLSGLLTISAAAVGCLAAEPVVLFDGRTLDGWDVLTCEAVVQDGAIRFEFKDIFLEKERVPLMLLDMIVFAASQLGKTDATSISQWHRLPPGIRDIRTADGRFTLFY